VLIAWISGAVRDFEELPADHHGQPDTHR